MPGTLFLGYSSTPAITREAIQAGGRLINSTGLIDVVSWEKLGIAGRIIIRCVLDAIDSATVCAFGVSTGNQNVLFELGYAIARSKNVWLLLDKTDTDARESWRQFQLLTDVGYTGWGNSEDIRTAFINNRPDCSEKTLYDDLLAPALPHAMPGSLLYMPSYNPTEPARRIERRLDQERRRGVRVFVADPRESSINPLQWYAGKAYETQATVVHFDAPRRELAGLHNARAALIAGMALGFDRPVLMLAEENYAAPLDYEKMLSVYRSGRECALTLDAFLREQNLQPQPRSRTQSVKLVTELRGLRFGEHVAENEIDLLSNYFVPTAAFDDVIANRNTLFVGRKGTGKTASMYQAAARLSEDVRNLVVVIKPPSYEFSSLLSLLSKLPLSLQQYSIEALWKFLLQSEIAKTVVDVIETRTHGIPCSEAEKALLTFSEEAGFGMREEFGARFEQTITALEGIEEITSETTESRGRDLLNEALHTQAIGRLRKLLGPVLRSRQRVAVLIDNLDKGWDRSTDLPLLSQLLLGLLSAIGRVMVDFGKEDVRRERVNVTVTAFLRSDIYAYVRTVAREPDKIAGSLVQWQDKDVLLRVLEERFLAARPEDERPEDLWERFFCPTINEIPTRDFLVSHVLPRPRDLIYLCNAAVVSAVNQGAERVEERHFRAALYNYSQFAFESLLVENGITISAFKDVLFEFLGEPPVVTEDRVRQVIRGAGIREEDVDHVFSRLKAISFLGVETAPGRFEYPESGQETERASILARKASQGVAQRLSVHNAYRAYLEMKDEPEH